MRRRVDDDVRFGDVCSLDLQGEIVREAENHRARLKKIRKGKSGPAKTEERQRVGVAAGTTLGTYSDTFMRGFTE